ncbi:MAG: DUF362 domain-containing protein [archaeon]
MLSKVYFSKKFDSDSIINLFERVHNDLSQITPNERVAIKVHFGEKGNTRFVSPRYIKPIIDSLNKFNSNYFITDANTLYKGMRVNATDHKQVAKEHGFYDLNSEITIADGELGENEELVKIPGRIFSEVKIGKAIADSSTIIAISHFKGHNLFSFAGAIKNLGMGCASKAGKQSQHSNFKPAVNENCILCRMCINECPVSAIIEENSKAVINQSICIGCAKCIAVCNNKAIRTHWLGTEETQKRTAEYALGAMNNKKGIFFNFINNVTEQCDCAKEDSRIICKDIGIVASTDPVACDKASYDLVIKESGKDIFKELHECDGTLLFDYAQDIGLGKKEYELVEL